MKDTVTQYIKSHPRLLGTLFVVMLAFTQVGTAVAGGSYTDVGP